MQAMTAEEHRRMTPASRWISGFELAAIGIAGAVILSPYLLPMIGIGNVALAEETMFALHSDSVGQGLAGFINQGLSAIPGIGAMLAEGGWKTTLVAGIVGIGGTMMGNRLGQNATTPKGLAWAQVISKAALITSALISLPTLLTAVSAGVVYLASALFGADLGSSATALMSSTLGSVGTMTAGVAGVTGLLGAAARMLACCMPMVPAGMAAILRRDGHVAAAGGPMNLDVALRPPAADGRIEGRLLLTDFASGRPVSADVLAVRHEHPLHLMAIDGGLGDYHHLHPEPTGEPGVFAFSFVPSRPGPYHFWSDAARGTGQSTSAHALAGEGTAVARAEVWPQREADAGGLHFRWNATPPLRRGQDSMVEIALSDAAGRPVTDLEPIMGAPAHLVGFGADHASMLHLHPVDSAHGSLRFHVRPESDAPAKFFLQVKRGGEVVTAPFGQTIFPAKQAPAVRAERMAALQPAFAR